jgi:hypothetical protein
MVGSFHTGTQRTYDISRDGQRFLMIKNNAGSSDRSSSPASMIVVQHWFEELKARLADEHQRVGARTR